MISCGHRVDQTQLTRLSRAYLPGALPRTLQRPFRPMRRVRQCGVYGTGEIELSVTVRIRTGELKERPSRRVQYVRLRCRSARGRTLKLQLEAQLPDVGECLAKCERGCAVAAQPLAALLALGGRADQGELQGWRPDGGLRGAAGSAAGAVAGALSAAVLGRADRRCCFSCWRTFRVSSLCLRA